ncbi:unnamed protein product [Caenorhabditis auriculariae]|uniref:glucuronosyltransferase n=1 Tax=Caenorhabditis auriculariae TaxID=2777116 RepID=A0A8S1HI31_9PELO|nr:unnamed protein product [Caenorhabditis auriculariae]
MFSQENRITDLKNLTWLHLVVFAEFIVTAILFIFTTVGVAIGEQVCPVFLLSLLQFGIALPGLVYIIRGDTVCLAIYISLQSITGVCELVWFGIQLAKLAEFLVIAALASLAILQIVSIVVASFFRHTLLNGSRVEAARSNESNVLNDSNLTISYSSQTQPEMHNASVSLGESTRSSAPEDSRTETSAHTPHRSSKNSSRSEKLRRKSRKNKAANLEEKIEKIASPSGVSISSLPSELPSTAQSTTVDGNRSFCYPFFDPKCDEGRRRMRLTTVFAALFGVWPSPSEAVHVALFPSTGCFSHDVMMRQVGSSINADRFTWVQTFLYDFGFGQIALPSSWRRISLWGFDSQGQKLIEEAGALLWELNVPFDIDRPFDLRGISSFLVMLQRHQKSCEKMMSDSRFQRLRHENVDVVVLDHFLQECMGGLAHLLNASVVQFSNWPIADGYITSLNVPATPSAFPKTGTRLSGNGMNFLERCMNVVFHVCIVFTRFVQMHVLDTLFISRQHPTVGRAANDSKTSLLQITVERSEARRTIYAGRSELLFEVVRPINNRIRHFGAGITEKPQQFATTIDQPYNLEESPPSVYKGFGYNSTTSIGHIHCENTTMSSEKSKRRSWMFGVTERPTVSLRRDAILTQFPDMDWKRIDSNPFILVSFGSVAQVDKMSVRLLRSLLDTFARIPRLVVWQANASLDRILQREKIELPDNVLIYRWVPIKQLLAHPRIELIVCHGGINTVNELMLFGVPVLGVPLQGDQASNLKRVVELGAGEMLTIHELSGHLEGTMRHMLANLERYWLRSEKLSRMLEMHREMRGDLQGFWLNWTARHGRKLESRTLFRMEYLGDVENVFWASVASILVLSAFICAL